MHLSSLLPFSTLPSLLLTTTPIYAWIQVDPAHNTCNAVGGSAAVGALLTDIVNLASNAYTKIDIADNVINFGGTLSGWDLYTLSSTYDAFFDATLPDSKDRKAAVKTALQTLSTVSSNPPAGKNIYVSCDDRTLWQALPNTTPQGFVFDDPVANVVRTGYSSANFKRCQDPGVDGNGQPASQLAYQISIGGVEYIFLCLGNYGRQGTLDQLPGAPEGSALQDQTTWSTTLFHELLHVYFPTAMRGDQSGGSAPGGERYGWAGAQEVRSTYGPENPDSVTLFALAMAPSPYLWFSGVAVSRASEWNRLNGNGAVGAGIIKNFGLTQP